MIKMSHLAVTLLFASISSVVYAEAAGQPSQPAAQGAASVEKNIAAETAKGNTGAVKGLTNAEQHITAKHGKGEKSEAGEKSERKSEKREHTEKAEHPAKPEHPGR